MTAQIVLRFEFQFAPGSKTGGNALAGEPHPGDTDSPLAAAASPNEMPTSACGDELQRWLDLSA